MAMRTVAPGRSLGAGSAIGHSLSAAQNKAGRGGGRGPNLIASIIAGWTIGGPGGVTQDAGGIHFVLATNTSSVISLDIPTLEDNATYELIWTVANVQLGTVRGLLYGPTSGHLGATGNRGAGTFVEYLTTSAAGTLLRQLRFQATGTSTNNTYDITAVSLKKVL